MAAAFVGKWKLGKIEGAEEYLAAVGQAEAIKDISNIKDVDISVDGNTFTSVVNIEGKEPRKDTSVLGETVETDAPGGIKIKVKSYLEGDKFIQEGTAGGVEWKVLRYIKDGAIFTEMTASGKTMTFTLVKA
ncbi:unnamed protein product [Lymnaea stagnalis]|uniref:Uncharacterized protein n=1 Tax=Lymnaea stagnalis TaxID=6523 RepID=A0AAV2HGN1_LYMST